ncbi:MAG: MMPL family transporter, partial [Deltaproteobacteria bacterium]|nr:MMPL family transporter [Deltaproteobacteria bacterium]
MADWRLSVETRFERLGHAVFRHKFLFALFSLAVFGLCILQAPKTKVDTAPTAMLHKDSPAMRTYDDFRERFGRDEVMVITVGPADIFSEAFLAKLKAFHEDLENSVPHLDEVKSLLNARNTRGEGDMLVVEDLLEDWPEVPRDMNVLKKRVLENPLYQNLLISEDGRTTALAVKTSAYSSKGRSAVDDFMAGFSDDTGDTGPRLFLTDEENSEAVLAVQEVAARHEDENFPIHMAGTPISTHEMKQYLMADMKKFSALGIGTVAAVLFMVFRTVTGLLWPLATVILALASTLGLMAATGTPLTMPTQILPSFIMAVGVGDSVHILAIFYCRLIKGDSREDAMSYALGHSGLAIVLTSLTTAGGLLSFATAEIAPIGHLGVFAAAGVMLALFYTIFFLPSMVAIFPPRIPRGRRIRSGAKALDRFLGSIGAMAVRNPWKVLGASGVLIAVAFAAALSLHFSHDPLRWWKPDAPIRRDSEWISEAMKGTVTMEVLVDAKESGAFYDPTRLKTLDRLAMEAEAYEHGDLFVGQTSSCTDVLKEIHQALNENQKDYYAIPDDRRLCAQEFLLFENAGADDLEDLVEADFSLARLTIKLPSVDALEYDRLSRIMEKKFAEAFGPPAQTTFTGLVTLLSRTFTGVMRTMAESYVIAFVVITILMILLIGSTRMGLFAMIPNFTPIILCL